MPAADRSEYSRREWLQHSVQAAAAAVQHRDAVAQADALQQLCASNAADRAESSAIMHRLQAELQEARAAAGLTASSGASGLCPDARRGATVGELVPIDDLIEARTQAARARADLLALAEERSSGAEALQAEVRRGALDGTWLVYHGSH
jgi:hypothetical protein